MSAFSSILAKICSETALTSQNGCHSINVSTHKHTETNTNTQTHTHTRTPTNTHNTQAYTETHNVLIVLKISDGAEEAQINFLGYMLKGAHFSEISTKKLQNLALKCTEMR